MIQGRWSIGWLGIFLLLGGCGPDVQTEAIEVNDARIYLRSSGAGEPLIVVHGGPGLDHSYLLPGMEEGLSGQFRVTFYDQRACGLSSTGADLAQISIAGFVEDLEAVRRHVAGDAPVHVLGHSWGGLLAMYYALRHGEKVKSLILVSSVGASSALHRSEQAMAANRRTRKDSLERAAILRSPEFRQGDPRAYEALIRLSFKSEFYDTAAAQELNFTPPADFAERSKSLQNLAVDLSSYDLHSALEDLRVPVLLIYGNHDLLSRTAGPRIHSALPNSHYVTIPDCGHFPYIEQPGPLFVEIQKFTQR